jgi:hypothetical protein
MMVPEAKRPFAPSTRFPWSSVVAKIVAWTIILGLIAAVCAPALKNVHSLGQHDWDQMEAHRYLVTKTIRVFHQFPFWNPYGCGGHTSWGGVESGTVVVSPWLLPYLFLSLGVAMRIEIVGMALLSAIGTWFLAGRFTRSSGARALACAVFVVNGRWALQAATGHTWHLAYAWVPWVFYGFDIACRLDPDPRRKTLGVVLAGVAMAMMVYTGGIYPLPQTALLLTVYAGVLAITTRRPEPVIALAGIGVISLGLSAPKLLPILDMLGRFPRLVLSTESIDLSSFLILLTSRDQGIASHPATVPNWGWHEYGMYIGWGGVLVLVCGAVFSRGPRATALKWTAVLALLLGFGDFHEYSPWNQLHRLPIFRSQHVPTRWEYPAVLLFGVLAAIVAERVLQRAGRARPLGEIAWLAAAAWVAIDISRVSVLPMQAGFGVPAPALKEEDTAFRTEKTAPPALRYAADWAPPALSGEIANIGTIDCSTFPGLNSYVREGLSAGLGAKGKGDPAYKGEVFTASQKGTAAIETWTPNIVTVRVTDGVPGDLVVLNQNYDSGWKVNGSSATNYHDTVATRIDAPSQVFVFRYRSPWWGLSLAIFVLTVAGIGLALWVARTVRRYTLRTYSAQACASGTPRGWV